MWMHRIVRKEDSIWSRLYSYDKSETEITLDVHDLNSSKISLEFQVVLNVMGIE